MSNKRHKLIEGGIWSPARGYTVHERTTYNRVGLCGPLPETLRYVDVTLRDSLRHSDAQWMMIRKGVVTLFRATKHPALPHGWRDLVMTESDSWLRFGLGEEPYFLIGEYTIVDGFTVTEYSFVS